MKKILMSVGCIILSVLLMCTVPQQALGMNSEYRLEVICDIGKDGGEASAVQSMSRMRMMDNSNEKVNQYRMVQNLVDSGICGEKAEAIALIAQMLFDCGMEAEFIAGVCGNILCEGHIGMFERDWGGGVQSYLPSRMSGDPYNYDAKYGNRLIYKGYSLSKVYRMAKDLYYSYDWNKGRYMFGLGCVQWTQKRTVQLIEYYIAEAGGSDTITKEQCIAAEMKFIKHELTETETGAYEHWIAGDHKNKYKNDAARAGYCVAKYYERCNGSYYSTRAETALTVYEAMLGRINGALILESDIVQK